MSVYIRNGIREKCWDDYHDDGRAGTIVRAAQRHSLIGRSQAGSDSLFFYQSCYPRVLGRIPNNVVNNSIWRKMTKWKWSSRSKSFKLFQRTWPRAQDAQVDIIYSVFIIPKFLLLVWITQHKKVLSPILGIRTLEKNLQLSSGARVVNGGPWRKIFLWSCQGFFPLMTRRSNKICLRVVSRSYLRYSNHPTNQETVFCFGSASKAWWMYYDSILPLRFQHFILLESCLRSSLL